MVSVRLFLLKLGGDFRAGKMGVSPQKSPRNFNKGVPSKKWIVSFEKPANGAPSSIQTFGGFHSDF